jgi:CII-binding regulator of phage lambda lysogenization HflD
MMQFLKRIFLGEQTTTELIKVESLETEINRAHMKIISLEERLSKTSKSILELSECVQDISRAYQGLARELMLITSTFKQVALRGKRENDLFAWGKKDDDGYLN